MSYPPDAADDSLRFFQPDGHGRVMLPCCTEFPRGPDPGRPFFEESEKLAVDQDLQTLYKSQPVWFHPRRQWPQRAKTNVPIGVKTAPEIKAAYADVIRPEDITEDEWGLHQKHIHEFLVTSNKEAWAEADSLHAMLRIITRGLDHIVAIGHYEMKLITPGRRGTLSESSFLEGFGGLTPANSIFKTHTHGKRLYANFVHVDNHWVSIVWDKRYGQLYYFDSWETERLGRAEIVRIAWKRFLKEAGYPGAFDLCVAPYTQQPSESECGYLALFALLTTLRGLVGCQISDRATNRRNNITKVYNLSNSQMPIRQVFDLRIRDWCLHSPNKHHIGYYMGKVYSTLEAIAGNELGICRSGVGGKNRDRHTWTLKELTNALDNNGQWKKCPIQAQNYTWVGGWSPLAYGDDTYYEYPRGKRVFSLEQSVDLDQPIELYASSAQAPVCHRSSVVTGLDRNSSRENTPISQDPLSANNIDTPSPSLSARSLESLSNYDPATYDHFPSSPTSDFVPVSLPLRRLSDKLPLQDDLEYESEEPDTTLIGQTNRPKAVESSYESLILEDSSSAEATHTPRRGVSEVGTGGSTRPGQHHLAPRVFRVKDACNMVDSYQRSIDRPNLDRLGQAGRVMTVDRAQNNLGGLPRSVGYTAYSNSFCSLMPPGLMDETVWERARSELEQAVKPPNSARTRARRAMARDAKRKQSEKEGDDQLV